MGLKTLGSARSGLAPWRAAAPRFAAIAFTLIALAVGHSGSVQAATAQNANSPLGTNLAAVSYWSSEMPFLNIIHSANGWITHSNSTWDTNEEQYLNLDANGWPMTLTTVNDTNPQQFTSVGIVLNRIGVNTPNGYYPAGQYVVLYQGTGTLSYGGDATLASHSAGRDVLNVTPTGGGILLSITATDPNHTGDYLRNIQFVKAENEAALKAGQVFNPVFLNLLQNFRALRFMDWFQTNSTTLSSWTQRPLPTNAFWGGPYGVPIEAAVQLANALSADAWFNIPVRADNNYITQMASLVLAQLGTTQRAYVEFSNEVWNGAFPQYQYAANQGQALWPTQPGGGGGFDWNRNWYGMRVAQMCDIWKSVWGADSNRLVCVLAAQAANSYSATESLSCPFWSSAPCSGHNINAVAIAPYFGSGGVPAAWTSQSDGGLSSLFQSLYSQNDPSIPAGGDLNQTAGWDASYIAMLASYHLPLLAYEGGQSFANGSTAPLNNLYMTANRDARMGTAYTAYLKQWKAAGGQTFMIYDDIYGYASYGSWGALESIMQTTNPLSSAPPKWQAVQGFIAGNACWWSGCAGTVGSGPPPAPVPMPPANFAVH